MSKGIFITGTDTAVGKTLITGLIARELKKQGKTVAVFKPISSGGTQDAEFLKSFANLDMSIDEISPLQFDLPLAPIAIEKEKDIKIDIKIIFDKLERLNREYDMVLVEGIGGVKVPITKNYHVLDLIKDIAFPVIIVARSGLGTLNHTLLTIDALKQQGTGILGVVFNDVEKLEVSDVSVRTNAEIIEEESGVKVLGSVPYFSKGIDYEKNNYSFNICDCFTF